MKTMTAGVLILIAALGWACAATAPDAKSPGTEPPPAIEAPPFEQARCATAREVLDRYFEAIGGRERFEAIRSLRIEGGSGSALVETTQDVTLFLEKPDRLRQQGGFRIVLHDGNRTIMNNGARQYELQGSTLEEFGYRLGFYHAGFSLLKWADHFEAARLTGFRTFGKTGQYEITLPGAENGRDLKVHIDADTFLVDRIVFTISHPQAQELTIVNKLMDYKDFDGLLLPTHLVYDKVGWETSPTRFLVRSVAFDPVLDEALFADATIDFGKLVIEEGVLSGEIRDGRDGVLYTNVRHEDLATLGVRHGGWMDLTVGETTLKVRYLNNIQRSATLIEPEVIYLCEYSILQYPRLLLMAPGIDACARIPCKPGDALRIIPAEPPGEDDAPKDDESVNDHTGTRDTDGRTEG